MNWAGVLAVSAIAYLTKLAGITIPQRILDKPYIAKLAVLLPTSLLAALTAVQVFATGNSLVLDARAAGLAAGVVAYKMRAPFIVIVVTAAVVAALLRALSGIN
jgi:branched-subunit amino acid transport protein